MVFTPIFDYAMMYVSKEVAKGQQSQEKFWLSCLLYLT